MKLTVLPFVVAAMGLAAQVSARPIRVYVLTPEKTGVSRPEIDILPASDAPVAHMRWGLAASGAPLAVTEPWVKATEDNDYKPVRKHHCGGGIRMKAITFSNWVREKVGLEPIAPPPPHMRFPHHSPMHRRPEDVDGDSKIALPFSVHGGIPSSENDTADGRPRFRHFHYHHEHHFHRPSSFTGRLQRALLTLGPWEGRLVAFVLGCGVGSLLRMFYVLCVVASRSATARRDEDEVEVIFTAVEELPPPKYISDEKIPA